MLNKFNAAVVNATKTKSLDGTIQLGVVKLEFFEGKIKFVFPNYVRNANKQLIADMEQIIHNYLFEPCTKEVLSKLAIELTPIAKRLVV